MIPCLRVDKLDILKRVLMSKKAGRQGTAKRTVVDS